MTTVKNISDYINSFSPYNTQCSWDNSGMLVGDESKEVTKIGFALDLTKESLESAKAFGVDLIITHHPIIFKAQKNFLKGNLPYELAVSGISAISAHTCFDCAKGGVNDVLCELLELEDCASVPTEGCIEPMVRIGKTKTTDVKDFAKLVSEKLDTVCRVAFSEKQSIEKVAVCGGAGIDFLDDVISAGADVYVTGDCSHHGFLDAKQKGITLIAAGHFETENPSMLRLMNLIATEFPEIEMHLLKQSNPVEFIG